MYQSKTYKYCLKSSDDVNIAVHCKAVKACKDQDSYLALLENFPHKSFFGSELELQGRKHLKIFRRNIILHFGFS